MPEVKTRDESEEVMFHWYLISFFVPGLGFTGYRAQIINNDTMNLTVPKLGSIREQCGIEQEAVIAAISYMGYMTTDEMKGKQPTPPTIIRENSQAYLDGFEEGLLGDLLATPVNPYEGKPEFDQAMVVDWLNGNIAGMNKQRDRLSTKP